MGSALDTGQNEKLAHELSRPETYDGDYTLLEHVGGIIEHLGVN